MSPDQLWESLLRGDDFVTEVPMDRWDAEEYYDAQPGVPGRSVCKWGAFLGDVAGFDAEFFGISEREATAIDPQHRLLLETAWEAVEHGGLNPARLRGSKTGVFVGLMHYDYAYTVAGTGTLDGPYGYSGTSFSQASGRIAYALGIHGPAVSVDTACSSGLTAIHLACRSLHDGESDLALAGGVSVVMEPRKFAAASAAGMLSATGRCHAFDVAADGFVTGEGSAVLLLKRLADAAADGDQILGVIRGTAANQDGRTVTIATPSLDAQTAVYRAALATAGVDAGNIRMVEAHGTGTPVGDPIEYASLAQVYGRDGSCAVGSLKTNFGHAQSAAGALGVMKAILAVRHGVIPQSLHHHRLPEEMARIETNLFVPHTSMPWPANDRAPRRAAVSAYGMSGTNVHAIVEQAPESTDNVARSDSAGPLIFPLSSTSAEELRQTAGRLADWVTQCGDGEGGHARVELSDLAYTLACRRGHRPVRTSVVAGTHRELIATLRDVANGDNPYPAAVEQSDSGPVWVFSGQGSQWAGMGAGLLVSEPAFAAAVAELEPLIARESAFSVTEAMSAPQVMTGIDRVQPTVFAIQVALAATMKAYGVLPAAVIGHSMGEVAAAVVAGGLSVADGVRVICRRSRLMAGIAGGSAMASVELPADQVLSELVGQGTTEVAIAAIASPTSTVVGGEAPTIRELVIAWERRGVMAREIAVDVASHSAQVDPILDDLADELAGLTPMAPLVPYYSATSYDPREIPEWDDLYWVDNLRHTVRFAAAVQAALEDGHRVFAELAPHPLLTHSVEQTARSFRVPVAALAAMRREQQSPDGLRGLVADLHSVGAAVDFSVLYPRGRLVDAPLPTWTHRTLLLDRDGPDATARGAHTVATHPLLTSRVVLPEEPVRHVWQGEVGTKAQPWLGDHKVRDVAVLPGAAYCEMALAAATAVLGEACEVRDLCFTEMLVLEELAPVSAAASVAETGVVEFAVETYQDGERTRRAGAVLCADEGVPQPPAHDIDALFATHQQRVDVSELRTTLEAVGIQHGPAFAGLTAAHLAESHAESPAATVLAEVALPGPLRSQQRGYGVHPALLDACFQSLIAHPAVQSAAMGAALLPLGVRRLRAYDSTRDARYCFSRVTRADAGEVEADVDVLDERGTVLLKVAGLRLGTGDSAQSRSDRLMAQRLLTIEWEPRELPEADVAYAGTWLLIDTDDSGNLLAGDLIDAMKSDGAECTTMVWPHGNRHGGAELLTSCLAERAFTGVVVLMGTKDAPLAVEDAVVLGREHVNDLARIARELTDVVGASPRLYVVTRKAQTVLADDVANLDHAGLRGLVRVIGAEHPRLRTSQIDVDADTDATQLAKQLQADSDEDETAWRKGQWYTARLCRAPLRADERRTAVADYECDAVRLKVRTPGDLQSLEPVAVERLAPGPGQIEVAVTASSVNFFDVLVAFGRYPTVDGRAPELGAEFAGVVTTVGPGVTTHQVGDRVAGVSADGCWGTFVTCDAALAAQVPPGLTEQEAVAVGLAYATAWYGLHHLAQISGGERVLIHSATGGVGQAAIAIAQAAGAEIFATAGSRQRRDLLRTWGIQNVYDSRTGEFAELIRRDTEGAGVDIVLNSATGAAQRAGLELLTFGGRFVEIGKRDIYGDTRIGLFPFRRNLAFYAVDLALMSLTHPDKLRGLLDEVFQLTADRSLRLPDITRYPLAEAATAIRAMSTAQHTGKLVLDVPRTGHARVVVPPGLVPVFRRDGAYLITGGLGGLGLFLAEKMAEAGAGRIVLCSRSQPNPKAAQTIELIRATGADIIVECGDIAEAGTAQRLVGAATETGLPLLGVLHAAGVVEDATLTNITDELIKRDWAPKVAGALHLHQATAAQPLDWFCSFSSAAALVGSPGQGAYAAANSWLDAFTHWRRAQGLPASAIAWGPWSAIGRGTAMAEGDAGITPDEGAYAFGALLRHDRGYSGYAPFLGADWLTAFAQRSPFAAAFRSADESATETRKLRAELRGLPAAERHTHMRQLISNEVSQILRRSVDPNRPLSEYGLDSLSNLELRARIETQAGIRISSMDVTTVWALAENLCDAIGDEEAGPDPE